MSGLRERLCAESELCAAIFTAFPDANISAYREAPTPDLPLHLSWFPTSMPTGPALGYPRDTTWGTFCDALHQRREGQKDGPNIVPARFRLEPDGKHVRRLGANLLARTAIVLDVETNKETGEIPPPITKAITLSPGWATAAYTSHSHTTVAPRYRIILPLSEEIDHELPAVEVVADHLGLSGVIDTSKCGASSVFYLPSCPPGQLADHDCISIAGDPIDARWLRAVAGKLLAQRQVEQDRIAAEARTQAEARRQAKIAAGFDPDDSLIDKIRPQLDLEQILLRHGYDKSGDAKRGAKFRHPNSTSGAHGADIKTFAGMDRVYSHNANDPLHPGNLPEWCGVTAPDAFDVAVILDYNGDRNKAMRELAARHGLAKRGERKALAKLIFTLIREQATQEDIETASFAEGQRLGLTPAQVCEVARWVAEQATKREAV
jgi:hypothetical protein